MSAFLKYCQKFIIVVLFLSLIGCGTKSSPVSPEGATYPRVYPEPASDSNKNKKSKLKRRYSPKDAREAPFFQYPNRLPKN